MEAMEKTTLLQSINDEFSGRSSGWFDLVVFVPLTRDVGVDFIQKEILGCLGLDTESGSPAILIFNALREKKFLLLLDNLWARLDLRAIGISLSPDLRQGSKIAFTARSADVCSDMGASRWMLKMPLLNVDISMGWEVFCHDWGAERVLDEGVQDVFSKFRSFLDDDDCTIFGIYGMGGIGKTSLLRDMSNKFFRRRPRPFELVIFIVVPTDTSVDLVQKNIQMKILQRLGLDGESSDPKNAVSKALSPKKFLLLVDNLWVEVDFREIGIPFPPYSRKGSKIVFTTRSAQVCEETGAGRWKFKMPLLSRQSSWELFCQSLGMRENQWTEFTGHLAERVAAKCEGLPLALINVGRALAGVTDSREWEATLVWLDGSGVEIRNMEEGVLRRLKFSYDRLRDDRHKECLLYCSLFPQSNMITAQDLIEYWVGEGLLEDGDDHFSIDIARDRGLGVIKALKAECLLEDGGDEGWDVKLHHTVRQMAAWITSGKCSEERMVFSVNSGDGVELAPRPEEWVDSTRISLMSTNISQLPEMPHCRNLRTLLLSGNRRLSHIHGGFFEYMPILTVLDLSNTGLEILPPEINLLVALRFLDLSMTKIESLPKEVGQLTKLRRLILTGNTNLTKIPPEAISSLSLLQSLIIFEGAYYCSIGLKEDGGSERSVSLKDLEGLERLDELGLNITIESQADFQAVQDSQRLCSIIRSLRVCLQEDSVWELYQFFGATTDIRKLTIFNCVHLSCLRFPANLLEKLETLTLWDLNIETILLESGGDPVGQPVQGVCFQSLVSLCLWNCERLGDITWTRELPCLDTISVTHCLKMVDMIATDEVVTEGVDGAMDSFFPKLKSISLAFMWNLKSVCRKPLLFPALVGVYVEDCPELKKLPFGLNSAVNITTIEVIGKRENDFEWDSEGIRNRFTPYLSFTNNGLLSLSVLG